MRIMAPLSLPLMLAAAVLAAPSAAEDSTSTAPLATTGYTAPSAGVAQSAATADRALRADTATRADQAARADVADSLSEGATPPTPAIPVGYVCGKDGKPRCPRNISLVAGVYTYSCSISGGENPGTGRYTIRIDPSYGRKGVCGSSVGGGGIYILSGRIYWVKRVG